MLPIARRKTMTIPHGLAAIAAAICLALAFVTDFQQSDDHLRSQLTASAQVEAPLNGQEESLRERASSEAPRTLNRERPGLGPGLMPWLPTHRNGH